MRQMAKCGADSPAWVPAPALWYLSHTTARCSIRALARQENRHASTILRHVRRLEQRRDDPLIDTGLERLGRVLFSEISDKDCIEMTAQTRSSARLADETTIEREARRILRRLSEPGVFLAIAPDLENAVLLRDIPGGDPARLAVLTRNIAEAFALKDWIACARPGRVATYRITQAGRAALKRLLAADPAQQHGFAEAPAPFADQHRDWDSRQMTAPDEDQPRRMRYNAAESPLALLARRRDRDGTPFLSPEMVSAGERLREDFELAQMGPRVAQNWDRFLTGADRGAFNPASGPARGPQGARDRVAAALRDLGPGLGDVVLRCCCFLEGMEAAEKRMGWSARSGKIVLRIALIRLARHYRELAGSDADLIG